MYLPGTGQSHLEGVIERMVYLLTGSRLRSAVGLAPAQRAGPLAGLIGLGARTSCPLRCIGKEVP